MTECVSRVEWTVEQVFPKKVNISKRIRDSIYQESMTVCYLMPIIVINDRQ